jgi:hypothetical protein
MSVLASSCFWWASSPASDEETTDDAGGTGKAAAASADESLEEVLAEEERLRPAGGGLAGAGAAAEDTAVGATAGVAERVIRALASCKRGSSFLIILLILPKIVSAVLSFKGLVKELADDSNRTTVSFASIVASISFLSTACLRLFNAAPNSVMSGKS